MPPCYLLNLPRELRDMVYLFIVADERPPTSFSQHARMVRSWGEFTYTEESPPGTCAGFLACNRQIYKELSETLQRAKEKGTTSLKLECIPSRNSGHCHLHWLRIPLVKTARSEGRQAGLLKPYQRWYCRMIGRTELVCWNYSTLISQLWVDVKVLGDRFTSMREANMRKGIFAALLHIILVGPDFRKPSKKGKVPLKNPTTTIRVDEVIINVMDGRDRAEEAKVDGVTPSNAALDGLEAKAKQLVDMWNQLWAESGDEGICCSILLERINRVRVCVNGQTYRVRELALELERGRAERRRIGARLGY